MSDYLNKELFQIVSQVASSRVVRAFVIGGYVRDCFLGRPSNDIDIVVVKCILNMGLRFIVSGTKGRLFTYPITH